MVGARGAVSGASLPECYPHGQEPGDDVAGVCHVAAAVVRASGWLRNPSRAARLVGAQHRRADDC